MELSTVLYLGLGRLAIFYIQKSPYANPLKRWGFLKQLLECDLCLGWWVYLVLSFVLQETWFSIQIPIISQLITCSCASFLMWLLRQGWDNQFREIHFTE